jgi:hypothetical protein
MRTQGAFDASLGKEVDRRGELARAGRKRPHSW